jgi:nucleotide-binding universal stress UspA family protein
MDMKKILIPTDFSECAINAVQYGVELAKVFNAEIILCHSFSVPLPGITDTLAKNKNASLTEAFLLKCKMSN